MSTSKENVPNKRRTPWFKHHNPGTRYVYDGPRRAVPTIRVLSNVRLETTNTIPFDPRQEAVIPKPTPKPTEFIKSLVKPSTSTLKPASNSAVNKPKPNGPKHPRVLAPSPPRLPLSQGKTSKPTTYKPKKRRLKPNDLRNKLRAIRERRSALAESDINHSPGTTTKIPWRKPARIELPPSEPTRRHNQTIPWRLHEVQLPPYEKPKIYDATGKDPRSCKFRVVITMPPIDAPRRRPCTPPTPRMSPVPSRLSPLPVTPRKNRDGKWPVSTHTVHYRRRGRPASFTAFTYSE